MAVSYTPANAWSVTIGHESIWRVPSVCKVLSIATIAGSVSAEQHFKEMSLRFETVGSVARRGIELNPPRICSPGFRV